MSKSRKTIFFVGHEAHRTGAPLLLLNLIKWVHTNRDFKIYILLLDGGILVKEYEKYGQVIIFHALSQHKLYFQKIQLWLLLSIGKPEFIYFNTVATLKFHKRFNVLFESFKKILHVHEMPFSINHLTGSRLDLDGFNKILVVNKIIEEYIRKLVNEKTDIFLTPEYIDVNKKISEASPNKTESGKKIILGIGVTSWRKGFDFFLQTAAICHRQFPGEFHFKWVGSISKGTKSRIEYEIALLGIEETFSLEGETNEVNSFYQAADLFFLCSREDPYPLVMLEAAYHKLPVLYFQQSGGAEEFFNFEPFEIPFGDCFSSALRIKDVLGNLSDYTTILESFQEKSMACDSKIIIPKIFEFIESNGRN